MHLAYSVSTRASRARGCALSHSARPPPPPRPAPLSVSPSPSASPALSPSPLPVSLSFSLPLSPSPSPAPSPFPSPRRHRKSIVTPCANPMNSKSMSSPRAQQGYTYTGALRQHDTLGVCSYMHFFVGIPVCSRTCLSRCVLIHAHRGNQIGEYKENSQNIDIISIIHIISKC